MPTAKTHGLNVSLSTIATLVAIIPAFWFVGKPAIVESMASEIEEVAEQKQAPMKNAFKVLLQAEITSLRKEIAKLETHQGDEDWAEDDAEYLAELEMELEALKEAKAEL
jgi:mono/diheme cytochrome c family protein